MALIRGYIAASVDGYIASDSGDVDWLEPFNAVDYGYERFIGEIRTVVLGRKTYDQCLELSTSWVYPGKRALVVTSRPIEDPPSGVAPWTDGIPKLVQHLRALEDGDVWIVGGAQLQTALFELDALDRLELFIIPVLLGSGVALFPAMTKSKTLSLVACEAFDMGVVRVDYRLR